jgi:hypothetical protein
MVAVRVALGRWQAGSAKTAAQTAKQAATATTERLIGAVALAAHSQAQVVAASAAPAAAVLSLYVT